MKKILSLFISFMMLFNLTAEVFAQQIGIKTNTQQIQQNFGLNKTKNAPMKRMEQEYQDFQVYMNTLDKHKSENIAVAKTEAMMAVNNKHMEQRIIESVPDKERAVATKLGANFYDFKNALAGQDDVDLGASWREYCKGLADYYEDYTILIRKFGLDNLSYNEIVTKVNGTIQNNKNNKVTYGDREYSKEAFLHAGVHNLVTRKTSGYTQKSMWIFGSDSAEEFSIEQKMSVMPFIYSIVAKYGYYPEDREFIWLFAYDIVKNGKKYFDNDTYKADILPGLSNADDRQKRDHGKQDRQKQANAVSMAMAVLPLVSDDNSGNKFSNKKSLSAQAIYDLMKDVMGDDYAAMGILTGARALISLDTEDSLSKLLTFLVDDCKKSFAKGAFDFAMGIFSAESWAKAGSRVADKNGGYAYNNSLTSQFTYMDKKKTDSNTAFFAEGNIRENYFNAIYTNIFEEIGRELGQSSRNSSKANSYATTFASRLSNKGFNANFSDDDLSASIVVGILDTAKAGSTSLNYAADLIYKGAWFDLNEATQRDKNNIAASYLGKPKKEYNKEKDDAFKTMMGAQDTAKYMDIAVNAVMMATLIASAPAILKSMANWTGKAISKVKTITGATKNVKLSTAPNVAKVTPRSYITAKAPAASAPKATTTAPKAATTAANAEKAVATGAKATTAPKVATAVNTERAAATAANAEKTAATAANAEKTAATATTAKPAPTPEEIAAANKAQLKSDFNKLSEKLFGNVDVKLQTNKLYSTIVPIVPLDIRELPSLTQFLNRNPAVRVLYSSSKSKIMKLSETESLSIEKARALFMEDFAKGLTESSLVPATQRANILETVAKELSVAYDAGAVAADAAKATQTAKALTIEEKEAALKALDKSVQSAKGNYLNDPINFTKLKMKGLLEDKYYSQVEKLIQNGMRNADNIISFRDAGLLESETFSKLEKLMDLGLKNTKTMPRMKKDGFFEEPMFSRFEEIAKNTPTKEWDFISKGLISDANYPKTKALLEKYNIREIYDFSADGILDAKYAELAKSGANTANAAKGAAKAEATGTTNAAQTAQTAKSASTATEMTKAEKMAYLEKKGITGWQIDAWERDIVNASGSKFERAQVLIDRGINPEGIYANKDIFLSDEGFASIQDLLGKKLDVNDFNKLLNSDLFINDGRFAMTEKLLQQGYKSDEIIALYKESNTFYYSNNADKVLARRKTLVGKGWSSSEAALLEKSNFAVDIKENYSKIETLMAKGTSKTDIIKMVDNGLLEERYYSKVSTLLEYKFTPEDMRIFKAKGVLEKDASALEYLAKHKANSQTILKLNEEDLLDNFAQTKAWMQKGINFEDMKLLRKITQDFNSRDIGKEVDLLLEKGFTPSQIAKLFHEGKLNNNLQEIETLLDRGADFDALMKYLN